ncbi:GH20442 [Drosophila grimshawi]|uniref:GH20442 n=1 Tax=Drosophila grimshawi TaxID=7222 RepID=B4J9P1_DROGR|nr:GH20442 [Drosophila grimshawi]
MYIILCFLLRILSAVGARLRDITEQMGAETSLLAMRLMMNRGLHIAERLLWMIVLLGSICTVYMLSQMQIARYFTSPTVISVDRDYRGWNGSLPAVTLCYYDHIDSFKANEVIQEEWNVSIIDEDYFYIMDFLYAVVNATVSNYAEITKFSSDERFDDINLYDVILAINRPFDQVISSFDANFKVHVQMVMTERGSCYAINSPMSAVLGKEVSVQFEDLPPPLSCQFGKQQCYIRMDLYESTGVLDVHSPYEVSATEANIVALHKSDEITASFKVLETVASKNLRELSIYSKSLCLARCRAVMSLEMCNCVPFFYPFVPGPSCNPAGFECLLDFKWPIWALHICKCPSTCTEIEYTMQTVKKSSWGMKSNEEATSIETATSSFRWDLIPPKVRFRRDVVFSFEDLIVSFGGALALFIGVSVMGLVQMGYIILINVLQDIFKLLWFIKTCLVKNCRRNKKSKSLTHIQINVSRAETAELPLFEYVN